MQLFYLGGPTIKIKIETQDGEVIVLINPHGDTKGLPKIKKQQAQIVLASSSDTGYFDAKISSEAFLVNTPGEFEIKDVLIGAQSVSGNNKKMLVFRLDLQNVSVGYLGGIDAEHDLNAIQNVLEGVDVLVIPVGGNTVLSSGDAMKLVSSLEPRIVIPIQYKTKEYSANEDTVESFLKEFGVKNPDVLTKIKIQRKDLPSDERRLVVLA